MTRTESIERERRVPRVVECKIELTFVKLGAAYYGMAVDVERKMEVTFVKLGAAYYGMWQSIYRKIATLLARSRSPIILCSMCVYGITVYTNLL